MTKPHIGHSSKAGGEPVGSEERGSSALARIFWMLVGNIILFFLAMSIYQKEGEFGGRDMFYWGTVILLILVRYCDIKYLGGLTAQSQPATLAHWRKYAVFVLLISAGIWLFAHGTAFLK